MIARMHKDTKLDYLISIVLGVLIGAPIFFFIFGSFITSFFAPPRF